MNLTETELDQLFNDCSNVLQQIGRQRRKVEESALLTTRTRNSLAVSLHNLMGTMKTIYYNQSRAKNE
jgi:hypothetical protein